MDIIFSGLLMIFCIYLYYVVGVDAPAATQTELGVAFWPRVILALMILLLIINLINNIKKLKAENGSLTDGLNVKGFLRSKLLVGMIMVVIFALILSKIGFIPSCLFFLIAYGFLLGERRPVNLVGISLIVTVIIYILFQGALDIMLPRGNGFFREFALMIERVLPF